jgi:hypothetical protein
MYQEENTNLLGSFFLFAETAKRYSLHARRAFFSTVHSWNNLCRFLDSNFGEKRRALALRTPPSLAGADQEEKGAKAATEEVAEE